MDFVTITDHNKIDGVMLLKEKYPREVFTGVELTTYFPENRCKIHVLAYSFTPDQFTEMDYLRNNIYDLREYLKTQKIPHSVAHATYSINNRLKIELLEKLILLFDVFEGINGGRPYNHNNTWSNTLINLNPDHIEEMYKKHRIEPMSNEPWKKGFTGGSDDHAGLFIGRTYTQTEADDVDSFLKSLKQKNTTAHGRNNDFYSLAFMIYKVGYEFGKSKGLKVSDSLLNNLNQLIFENKTMTIKDKFYFNRLKKKNDKTYKILVDLIEHSIKNKDMPIEQKLDHIYFNISDLVDEFFSATIKSTVKNIAKADLLNIIRKASSSLFGIFLTLPFISSLKHMFQDRRLLETLEDEYVGKKTADTKKILWFTDTITDLNGVSMTLKKIGWLTSKKNRQLKLVACLTDKDKKDGLPPNLISLPVMTSFVPNFYKSYIIKIPSILKTLKTIYDLKPDEIIISTPGPVGLVGLLCCKLLNVKSKAIYHSDFTKEFEEILGDSGIIAMVESYMNWFYKHNDEILVPTAEYIDILEDRGVEKERMKIFKRGIDLNEYYPRETGQGFISDYLNLNGKTKLLFTGRVSKDKNLDFLLKVFNSIYQKNNNVQLIIVGDGPYLNEMKSISKDNADIIFPGRIDQKLLPYFYSGSNVFVFPSKTDTFGMSVLEAQACGLPAVVSDIGGPKEIIIHEETGFVAESDNLKDWVEKINLLIDLSKNKNKKYKKKKKRSVQSVQDRYDWEKQLEFIFNS